MPLLDAYANFLKGRRRSSSELPKKQLYLTHVHSIYLLPCLIGSSIGSFCVHFS